MIKAVFFDWGGVLIEHPVDRIKKYCTNYFGVSEDLISKVHKKYGLQFEKDKIEERELWNEVCHHAGIENDLKTSLWKEAFRVVYSPRLEIFELVRDLKRGGYKVGVISNTEMPASELFLERHPEIFDSTTFSCRIGIAKPDAGIYRSALESLNVDCNESIFIDDSQSCIDGAEKIGLKGILYDGCSQIRRDLSSMGVRVYS